MMRQIHGLHYEKQIISKFNWTASVCHTAKFDATTPAGLPVQIKLIKQGSSIDMGDFKRNSTNTLDHLLVLGRWVGNKQIVSQDIHYITGKKLNERLRFEHTDEMLKELKTISNDPCDDKLWREFCRHYRSLYPKDNLFKLRFKRDHKKQRRIQCAMNTSDYKKFSILFPPVDIHN